MTQEPATASLCCERKSAEGLATSRRPFSVMAFTIHGERIVQIDILRDPERLRQLDLSAVEDDAQG